jgi:hypothetical protein
MASLFTKNKINAYKNKYNTSRPKLSLTVSLVQNKAMNSTTHLELLQILIYTFMI